MPSCIRFAFLILIIDPIARDRSLVMARRRCRP
jgi:hypothetical protein